MLNYIYLTILTIIMTLTAIPTVNIPFFVLIGLTIILNLIAVVSRSRLPDASYLKWCIPFFLFCVLSLYWSIDRRFSLYVIGINYLPIIVTMISVTIYAKTMKNIGQLLMCFYVSSVLFLLYFLSAAGIGNLVGGRMVGNIDDSELWNANYIAGRMAFAFYTGYFAIFHFFRFRFFPKFFFIITALVFILIIVLSGSRTSLLLLMTPALLYYVFGIRFTISKVIGVGLVFIGIISLTLKVPFLYESIGYRIEEAINIFTGNVSGTEDTSRIVLIEAGINWFFQNPWKGIGINCFRVMSSQIFLKHEFYAHNNYIELMVDIGIIGLLLYYIPIFRLLLCKQNHNAYSKFIRIFLITILLSDIFWVSYYNWISQFVICMLFMLHKINKKMICL